MEARYLVWLSAMRALKTYDALQLLAGSGYGEQSSVLSRTMVEDTIIAWWCSITDPKKLVDLMTLHDKSVALHSQQNRDGRSEIEILHNVPTLNDDQLAQFSKDAGVTPGRARSQWTKRSIPDMVRDIEPHLTSADGAVLRRLSDLSYLLSSLFVHHSPLAMGAAATGARLSGQPKGSVLTRSPSRLFVRDSLVVAFHSLSLVARLVATTETADDLSAMLEADRPLCIFVGAAPTVGRNDPCPRGSGRKYKSCHLRRA